MLKTAKFSAALVIIALAALSFFRIAMPFSYRIDEKKDPLFESFPMELGEWTGEETPVDERTYEILETRNVLGRKYVNPQGKAIYLLLVSSTKDRRVAHPPEVCYLGSNFFIVDQRDTKLISQGRELPVREFVAKSERFPDDQQQVLYLYKIGDQYTTNYYSQQLQFAWNQMAAEKDTKIYLIRLAGSDRAVFDEFLIKVLEQIP